MTMIASLILFGFAGLISGASIPYPFNYKGYDANNNKQYYGDFKEKRDRQSAVELCDAIGGQLLTLHSRAENRFVKNLNIEYVWLGVANRTHWLDGSEMDYETWRYDIDGGDPNCAFENFREGEGWENTDCKSRYFTICEVNAETKRKKAEREGGVVLIGNQGSTGNEGKPEGKDENSGNNGNVPVDFEEVKKYIDERLSMIERKLDQSTNHLNQRLNGVLEGLTILINHARANEATTVSSN